jgi:4-amino-4-deoxy-L-arabinose transferase-like glycosyltransferase
MVRLHLAGNFDLNRETGVATESIHRPARTPWLAAVVDFASASDARAAGVLIVIALLAFLPGFFQIRPVDRDEARFAQATKQMIESGDFVDIRFQDEARYKKPVGIYWLQAAVVELADAASVPRAHSRIALYRLPSLLGAIGAVLLTYWAALVFVSRRAAVLAAIMMATSILLGVEARLAKTDAMLLFTCVAAMGALGRAYLVQFKQSGAHSNPWITPAIFWSALAGGILLKGPLILLFVALTIASLIILDRSADWLWRLKPLPGVLWLFLLVLPWFIAIMARNGWSFFSESIGHDLAAKLGSGQETHGAPPGYYFVLFWVTFFPGSILAGLATPAVYKSWREPATKFLLAWLVPAWIVFEVVITKLPHYVLPLYPALGILIAGVVDRHALSRRLWLERGTVWWFLITVALAVLTVVANVYFEQQLGLPAWPFLAGAVILSFGAWWLYQIDGAEPSLLRAAGASILISIAVFGLTFPRLPSLFPAATISRYLAGVGCTPEVAAAGYQEPSLIFLVGTETLNTDGAGAANFLASGGCRFAVIEKSQERAFGQRADAIGLRYTRGPTIEGINYAIGRKASIAIFRAEGAR